MGIFTYLLVPETKGVPIEAVEEIFMNHWAWKRLLRKLHVTTTDADTGPEGLAPHHRAHHHEAVCKVVTTTPQRGVYKLGL